MASASFDCTVRLWDRRRNWAVPQILEHPKEAVDVAWNRDGTQLAVACGDGKIYLWDERGDKTGTLSGHGGVDSTSNRDMVLAVAWHPQRNKLASVGDDDTLRIWDLDTPAEKEQVLNQIHLAQSLSWHPNGYVLASSAAGNIRLWIDYRSLLLDYFKGRHTQKPTPQQIWLYSLLCMYKQAELPIYIPEFLAELGAEKQELEAIRNSLPLLVQQVLARILDIRKVRETK